MAIKQVYIGSSEYRMNCFDLKDRGCDRWTIQFQRINADMDEDFPEDAPHYDICTLHFTTYNLEKDYGGCTPQHAYEFFIKNMKVLIDCYKMENPRQRIYDDSRDPFRDMDLQDCTLSKGLIHFLEKLGIAPALYGQPLSSLFKELDDRTYIYYSSIKLLSYGYGGNRGVAFETYSDMTEFLDNPPPLSATEFEPAY